MLAETRASESPPLSIKTLLGAAEMCHRYRGRKSVYRRGQRNEMALGLIRPASREACMHKKKKKSQEEDIRTEMFCLLLGT